jgi:hypothetical protein
MNLDAAIKSFREATGTKEIRDGVWEFRGKEGVWRSTKGGYEIFIPNDGSPAIGNPKVVKGMKPSKEDDKKTFKRAMGTTEGRKEYFKEKGSGVRKALSDKFGDNMSKLGGMAFDAVAAEAQGYGDVAAYMKKLVTGNTKDIAPKERRNLISYGLNTLIMKKVGVGAALALIPPPLLGMAVGFAASSIAWNLIDRTLGKKYSGTVKESKDDDQLVRDFTNTITKSFATALNQVTSGKAPDKIMKTAMTKAVNGKKLEESEARFGYTPGCKPLQVPDPSCTLTGMKWHQSRKKKRRKKQSEGKMDLHKMAKMASFGRGKTIVQEARDELLSSNLREAFKSQWKCPGNRFTKVLAHVVNEETGQEYFITAWDGIETVSAWTASGMRNVNLREVYEGGRSAVHIDRSWNCETVLGDVRESRPVQESAYKSTGTRKNRNGLDSVVSRFNRLTSITEEDQGTPEYVHHASDPDLDVYRIHEDRTNTNKYTVATSRSRGGDQEWQAYVEGTRLPLRMTPVEVVFAINETMAIEQAKQLMEADMAPDELSDLRRATKEHLIRAGFKVGDEDTEDGYKAVVKFRNRFVGELRVKKVGPKWTVSLNSKRGKPIFKVTKDKDLRKALKNFFVKEGSKNSDVTFALYAKSFGGLTQRPSGNRIGDWAGSDGSVATAAPARSRLELTKSLRPEPEPEPEPESYTAPQILGILVVLHKARADLKKIFKAKKKLDKEIKGRYDVRYTDRNTLNRLYGKVTKKVSKFLGYRLQVTPEDIESNFYNLAAGASRRKKLSVALAQIGYEAVGDAKLKKRGSSAKVSKPRGTLGNVEDASETPVETGPPGMSSGEVTAASALAQQLSGMVTRMAESLNSQNAWGRYDEQVSLGNSPRLVQNFFAGKVEEQFGLKASHFEGNFQEFRDGLESGTRNGIRAIKDILISHRYRVRNNRFVR